jgi:hypothetical protein
VNESSFSFCEFDPINYYDPDGLKRTNIGDSGWSWDHGMKKPKCDAPDPNNPADWNEQPHLNDPDGNKYRPGDKLPRKTPDKVREFADRKGARYKREPPPVPYPIGPNPVTGEGFPMKIGPDGIPTNIPLTPNPSYPYLGFGQGSGIGIGIGIGAGLGLGFGLGGGGGGGPMLHANPYCKL